jgi:uncharacterized membrane protein YagU involved in acid resistance
MAGLISACVLQSLRVVIFDGGISLTDDFKFNLYRLMIWGGVWAILFIVPFCKNIIVRGFIIGIIVIMFNFMIKMPLAGLGFFGINAPASMILGNIFFNVLWGILAGIIYFLVIIRKNNNSKS